MKPSTFNASLRLRSARSPARPPAPRISVTIAGEQRPIHESGSVRLQEDPPLVVPLRRLHRMGGDGEGRAACWTT